MLSASHERRGNPPGMTTTARKSRAKARPKAVAAVAGRSARVPRSAALVALEKLALKALEDMKAVNIRVLDVRGLTDVADTMIVASGTSDRHVRSIAENVIVTAKAAGRRPLGTEGKQDGEWVPVDLQDLLVAREHVVALDERGRSFTTVQLSEWLGLRREAGEPLSFIIGGPDGLDAAVLARAQLRWSLSALTFPHALVRILLAEQLYRAATVLAGHPYHRAS